MRNYVWPIGVLVGGVLFIVMVLGWNYMQRDLDDKAQDMMVRHHNAHLQQMKDAGIVDPDTPEVTRESLEQRRQETLARLREAGGPEGLARQAHAEALGVPATTMPPTQPVSRPPPAASSGLDTQMTLLLASLGLILLLTVGGLGGAIYAFTRADQKAAEERVASGGPGPSHGEPQG